MLQIEHLTKKFGGLAAVNDVTTTIEQGKINAIIGPNGAGKTTFFNLISSMHKPTSGTITFDGQDVTSLRPTRWPGWAWRAPSRPRRCSTAPRCWTT
jgi:branched-chain amino acid transport system ATP-binding protein